MILADKKEEEGRLDAMMELERVAELKKLEEREKKRVEELRKGASKIREQISERREAALLEQERKDQETKMILEHIADVDEQDKREKMEKVEAQRRLMQEVKQNMAWYPPLALSLYSHPQPLLPTLDLYY